MLTAVQCEIEADSALQTADAWTNTPGHWHVLHTKSRQEKALSADLNSLGVPHFLPLIRQIKSHGDRKVIIDQPLFPSYLFVRGTVEDAYRADRTRRVAHVIAVADQTRIDRELTSLHAVLASGISLDPYPYLRKGIRVEVRSGPLSGVQGVVEDRQRADRLVLQVDMLGKAVSLEIDGALLDVLD